MKHYSNFDYLKSLSTCTNKAKAFQTKCCCFIVTNDFAQIMSDLLKTHTDTRTHEETYKKKKKQKKQKKQKQTEKSVMKQ